MNRVRRLPFLLAGGVLAGLYMTLLIGAGWDGESTTGGFTLIVAASGGAVVTLAALTALWRAGRGRSVGLAPFAAAMGALAAGIMVLLALGGMPVGTRGERAVVYWTAVVAALFLVSAGWVALRRR